MFDYNFWEKIQKTIKVFHLNFLYNLVGKDFLSKQEIKFLEKEMGKDRFKNKKISLLDKIFILGKLSQKLGIGNINEVNLDEFNKFVKEDNIPNYDTKNNKALNSLKRQAYLDVLGKQFSAEKEVRQVLLNEENRGNSNINMKNVTEKLTEKFEELSDIKTSVNYISESVFNEGRADEIVEENDGEDPYVYVVSRPNCCKYCRKVYQTPNGPRIFKLSELQANGNNIGIKNPNNWKATVPCLHPHCYDKETEVLTDEGWKFFKDLTGEEECLTFNIESENVEWSKINKRISYHYEGNMHLYEHDSFSLMVTPEHKQVVRNIIQKDNKKFYKTVLKEDNLLPNRNRFYKTITNYKGIDKKEITICGYIFNTMAFCAFMGYWLSEGSITYRENIKSELIIPQFKEEYFNDILKYSKLCFPDVKGEAKNVVYIYINNELAKWFKNFGHSYQKFIPNEIKELDIKYLEIFLEKYINGDGSRCKYDKEFHKYNFKGVTETISTSSYRMASDLSELILKVGKAPRFHIQDNRDKIAIKKDGSKIKSNHIIYRIELNKSQFSICKRKIVPYNDYVYCVEVEKNHTLFVKRKGNVTISGNCYCILIYLNIPRGFSLDDFIWNGDRYVINSRMENKYKEKIQRPKVKIEIGNKKYEV